MFDYPQASSGGLGGFLSFLVAEVVAQAVNFFVQKEWVFESKTGFETAAPKFALMAAAIVVVNLVLPGRVVALCQGVGLSAGLSSTAASAVNTLLAVLVSYPLLKYWIMPEEWRLAATRSRCGLSPTRPAGARRAGALETENA